MLINLINYSVSSIFDMARDRLENELIKTHNNS